MRSRSVSNPVQKMAEAMARRAGGISSRTRNDFGGAPGVAVPEEHVLGNDTTNGLLYITIGYSYIGGTDQVRD